MRRSFRGAAVAALLLVAACKSDGSGWQAQDLVDSMLVDVNSLLGSGGVTAKYVAAILEANERPGWRFREGVDEPMEKTRQAVRALATSDYNSWSEAALVVELLSEMTDEHPSSLVRAEALDTLTRIAQWPQLVVEKPEHPSTETEFLEALKVLTAARGRTDDDPAFTFQVAAAVSTVTARSFEPGALPKADGVDNKRAAQSLGGTLRTARVALRTINSRALDGFAGDPQVRDAFDRGYLTLSASIIRLVLLKAALGDASETTRADAVRNLGTVAPEGGSEALMRVLFYDGYASVRREAAKALASYPKDVVVPALIDGLADEMRDVRGAAVKSLETLTGQTFGDDRAAWVRWWQSTGSRATPETGK